MAATINGPRPATVPEAVQLLLDNQQLIQPSVYIRAERYQQAANVTPHTSLLPTPVPTAGPVISTLTAHSVLIHVMICDSLRASTTAFSPVFFHLLAQFVSGFGTFPPPANSPAWVRYLSGLPIDIPTFRRQITSWATDVMGVLSLFRSLIDNTSEEVQVLRRKVNDLEARLARLESADNSRGSGE